MVSTTVEVVSLQPTALVDLVPEHPLLHRAQQQLRQQLKDAKLRLEAELRKRSKAVKVRQNIWLGFAMPVICIERDGLPSLPSFPGGCAVYRGIAL